MPESPTLPAHDLTDWLPRQSPAAPADTCADDIAFWLYSSGSTGRPKGAVHTHANLYWTAALYAQPVLGLSENDVCFSAAKLFFAYGLGNALSFPLSVGATTVLMAERPTPAAVFARWRTHQPTVFFGAPTGYAGMLASPDLPPREAVALRKPGLLFEASGGVTLETVRQIAETGVDLISVGAFCTASTIS